MEPTPFAKSAEFLTENVTVQPPAVESFFTTSQAENIWPKEVTQNETFQRQIAERAELIANLTETLQRIPLPTTTIKEAIAQNQITENQAENLYNSLSDLLENPDYRRALLYLPFEFLPEATWRPKGEYLQQALDRFKSMYMHTWNSLLGTHDVRANFVDGDVIEVAQRAEDLPRVVKAAHLIPQLVQHNLLKTAEVEKLAAESDDPILKQSIADALLFLNGLNQTDQTESLSAAIPLTVPAIQAEFAKASRDFDSADDKITAKRRQWLKETANQKVTDRLAHQVSEAILTHTFTATEANNLIAADSTGELSGVVIEGIRQAIEAKATDDRAGAEALYRSFKEILLALPSVDNQSTRQLLAKTWRRLYGLGIVDRAMLAETGVSVPNLAGSMTENIKTMEPELQQTTAQVIRKIKESDLTSVLYPIVLFGGSRVKGYGETDSDLDMFIFVKPGTPLAENTKIRQMFPDMIEFWLEEDGDQLKVRHFPVSDEPFGSRDWLHNLYGSAWAGDQNVVNEIRPQVLLSYIYETNEEIDGRNLRDRCLEEIEKDMLQYRLMHKGYERYAPTYGRLTTPNADKIDGQSVFWDSGYRRVAIELYIRRVFLPKLTP